MPRSVRENHPEPDAATRDTHPAAGERQPDRRIPFGFQRAAAWTSTKSASMCRAMRCARSIGTSRPGPEDPSSRNTPRNGSSIILLVVDISASGNFGSGDQSKRDLAARSGKPSGAIRHSQQRQGRLAALHRPRRAIHAAEKGPTPCAARGTRDSLPHRRGPRHRYGEGARGRQPASASARRRVPDFRFSVARHPDPNPRRLRRAMRQTNRRHDLVAVRIEDPREKDTAGSRRALAGGRGNRRGDRARHRRSARARAFNEEAIERVQRLMSDIRSEGSIRWSSARIRRTCPPCSASSRTASAGAYDRERHRAIGGSRCPACDRSAGFAMPPAQRADAPAAGGAPRHAPRRRRPPRSPPSSAAAAALRRHPGHPRPEDPSPRRGSCGRSWAGILAALSAMRCGDGKRRRNAAGACSPIEIALERLEDARALMQPGAGASSRSRCPRSCANTSKRAST